MKPQEEPVSQGRQVGQSQGWFRAVRPGPGATMPPIATGMCITCEGLQCAQREAEFRLTLESAQAELILVGR